LYDVITFDSFVLNNQNRPDRNNRYGIIKAPTPKPSYMNKLLKVAPTFPSILLPMKKEGDECNKKK